MRRILTLVLCLLAHPVLAEEQRQCAPLRVMRDVLAAEYRESPTGVGVSDGGAGVIQFTARDGSSWTFVVMMPGGKACILASGRDWQSLPFTLPPAGDPS